MQFTTVLWWHPNNLHSNESIPCSLEIKAMKSSSLIPGLHKLIEYQLLQGIILLENGTINHQYIDTLNFPLSLLICYRKPLRRPRTYTFIFTTNGIVTHSIHQVHQASTSVCNQSNLEGLTIVRVSVSPKTCGKLKGGHLCDTLRVEWYWEQKPLNLTC